MWQKLDRLLGQKCCVFCGRSPTDPGPAVQVELVPPDAQKAVANGVVPPANGHVPNGLVASGRPPPQPGPHGAGPRVYQDTRVQLTGTFQPATSPSAGFFNRPAAQNGGAQPAAGGEVSRATAGPPPHVQQQGAYQQREAPRQTVSWGPPDPAGGWPASDATRPTSGHAGGPPAASLRHPYQPSPSKQPVPPSSAAATNGAQQGAAVTSRPDGSGPGTGTNRATLQWGAQVPPPAYSLPRQQQQQRPAEQAPPSTAATLPAGTGHDRSRPGEPPTAAGVT
ncbi:protein transport protein sec31-like, partial [Amphibalanus amphitrite]|uniref:protein transport protein sec31-like n=1 Tax=Amphibalanus amphitrite TaxID=1232801 RepID=UPI001C91C904